MLRDVSAAAVIEAAQRYTMGDVPGQNRTFAPSVAEFVQEARKVENIIPMRGRAALPAPGRNAPHNPTPGERERVALKMALWKASFGTPRIADLAMLCEQHADLEQFVGLGQTWGVPIPEAIWAQLEGGKRMGARP